MRLRRKLGMLALVAALAPIGIVAAGVRLDRPAAEVEARHAAPPSRFVAVDGMRVHYRDRGAGPVVVLLHGSSSSLFAWEGWAQALSADHRVVTLDLPGHGLTGPDPQARYRADDMAELLERFVVTLGIDRFTLGGNSMGGNVAWRYALAHPARVERLLLVDSAGMPREEPRPFAFRVYASPWLGRIARWVTPRFMIERSVRNTYAEPSRLPQSDVDLYEDMVLREGNREATRQRFAGNDDERAVARLSELRMPTLILWGERDRWILPKYGERLHAAIPGSRLIVLPALGHMPMSEDPAASLAAARPFLEEAPR